MDTTTRLLPLCVLCLSLSACGWSHEGPGASDIESAVRRALDVANKGTANTLLSGPFPTSADIEIVKADGECTKNGDKVFVCPVRIDQHCAQAGATGATLHAELLFEKDRDGNWQTSDIDQALAMGAVKSLIERASPAKREQAASNPC